MRLLVGGAHSLEGLRLVPFAQISQEPVRRTGRAGRRSNHEIYETRTEPNYHKEDSTPDPHPNQHFLIIGHAPSSASP